MKKLIKIFNVCLIVMVIFSIATSSVYAAFSWSDISANTSGTTNVQDVGNTIISAIRIGGMFLSVAVLMILGIKYMMGSAEEKAEYKKTMIPYVVGALFIFAAVWIVSTIYNFTQTK